MTSSGEFQKNFARKFDFQDFLSSITLHISFESLISGRGKQSGKVTTPVAITLAHGILFKSKQGGVDRYV
jgi:hypothetical protein